MTQYFLRPSFALVFLLSVFGLSCGQNQTENQIPKTDSIATVGADTISKLPTETKSTEEVAPVENIPSADGKITISTFTEFPPEIDGCSCYYSANESKFKSRIYLYADNLNNSAFVSINGTMTKFGLNKNDSLSPTKSRKTFSNEKYQVKIEVEQVGESGETWQQKGIMEIKSKTGDEMKIDIYGECGC
jgi:hypothetical protein